MEEKSDDCIIDIESFSDGTNKDITANSRISENIREAGSTFPPDELASIVGGHSFKGLASHGGVEGIARNLCVSLNEGVKTRDLDTRQKIYGLNRYREKPTRQKIYGLNRYREKPSKTFFFQNILMVCALVSVGIGIATDGWPQGMYDGLGIILCMLLVVMVTASSDYRQSLQFADLDRDKKKIFIHVTRDGKRQKVSFYDLVVGDIVHLSIGDQVPGDGIYISGYSLLIDESNLSGESHPVDVNAEKPFLLSGTKVMEGSGKMLVTTVGMRTEWGKLMVPLNEGGEVATPLQVKLNGVATIIGKIGLSFAVLTFVVLTVRNLVEKALTNTHTDWSLSDAVVLLNYFAIAVTILIVVFPERLPFAVTSSLIFAMKKLMGERALVRHLAACETMGSVSCICTGKTGMLTTNHMVVDKIWIPEKSIEVKANVSEDVLKSEISEGVLSILMPAIFKNTTSQVIKDDHGKNSIIGTPTESALLEFGLLLGGDFDAYHGEFQILKVEPFNSIRKKMSVLVSLPGGGARAFCKGASELVLTMCDKIVDCNGEPVNLPEEQVMNVSDVINGFATEALRTLCLAYKDIHDTDHIENRIPDSGYTLIAVVGMKNPVRPGVKDAVQTCLAAGITVRLVTGDNLNTAKAIARECGILTDDGLAMEGPEFCSLSNEEMRDIIPRIQVIARSLPMDKHTLVTCLKKMFGEVVAVTGNGTNDAPALHEADIGLSMGIAGTEVAKENADVIILDDNFTTIVNVAKWGRAVYINIQKFVQFQLTVKVVAPMLDFVCACISGSAPLTVVQLLWVNMIMDTLGALALVTEPPNDGHMERPSVGTGVSFITNIMWRNIIGQSIYQLAVLAILTFDGKRLLKLTGSDASDVLNTLIFNSFVFCQVFNGINSREIEKINIFRGMFDSWMFLGVIVSTVAFQVIIVEFLGDFASTVPLSWQLWLLSILIGSVSLLVDVILKCVPVAGGRPEYKLLEEAGVAGFTIRPDELASIVHDRDIVYLTNHGGVEGIARKVFVVLNEGVNTRDLNTRKKIYGLNRYTKKPFRTFLIFAWEALHDLTIVILMVCAVVSVGAGLATDGWPKGMYDGLVIIIFIFLVVTITARNGYRQSLHFVKVTRDGKRQNVSFYDLVVGDIVHLAIGEQVPGDGIYISGNSLRIDESSLSGESHPVDVHEENPFLLSGTKVAKGSGKMLVTTVGMRTEWGKLMEALNEGGEDETPPQVKVNGVASIIGKIGLSFAVLSFAVFVKDRILHLQNHIFYYLERKKMA